MSLTSPIAASAGAAVAVESALSQAEVDLLEYEVQLLEWQGEHCATKEASQARFASWREQTEAKPAHERTIFVSIPSYRDEECPKTLLELYARAAFPGRVHVGIYQQNEASNVDCLSLAQKLPKGFNLSHNIRVMRVASGDAQGPTHARSQIQQHMFKDQDYFMSIDSHMLFTPGWDSKCISQLHSCPAEKPVLTTYPLDYNKDSRIPATGMAMPTYIRFNDFNMQARVPQQERMECFQRPSRPIPSIGYAAGFNFAPGVIAREVPYDPHTPYLFIGEETFMALRMYTAGYDLFCPSEVILYHLMDRKYRPMYWEQYHKNYTAPLKDLAPIPEIVKARRKQLEAQSMAKVQALFAGDATNIHAPFGLGAHRTMKQYWDFVGVDYAIQTVYARAKQGLSQCASMEEQLSKYGRTAEDLLGSSSSGSRK